MPRSSTEAHHARHTESQIHAPLGVIVGAALLTACAADGITESHSSSAIGDGMARQERTVGPPQGRPEGGGALVLCDPQHPGACVALQIAVTARTGVDPTHAFPQLLTLNLQNLQCSYPPSKGSEPLGIRWARLRMEPFGPPPVPGAPPADVANGTVSTIGPVVVHTGSFGNPLIPRWTPWAAGIGVVRSIEYSYEALARSEGSIYGCDLPEEATVGYPNGGTPIIASYIQTCPSRDGAETWLAFQNPVRIPEGTPLLFVFEGHVASGGRWGCALSWTHPELRNATSTCTIRPYVPQMVTAPGGARGR